MSYPKVIATKYYALVEVRASATDIDYNSMSIIYSGPFEAGAYMEQPEGWKMGIRRSNWPTDPTSGLGSIYTVKGWNGISEGNPEVLNF